MLKPTATKRAVVVIAPQWVGDAILSLPLIRQLATEYDTVDVIAVPAVQAVYLACPEVHTLRIEEFKHGKLQFTLRKNIAAAIRGRYTSAVICPNSLKSALIPWLARIPIRRGTTGESRYWLINDRRDPKDQGPGKRPSMLRTYLGLADTPLPAHAIDSLGLHRPALSRTQPVTGPTGRLVLCPGAEFGPAKQWPASYFAEVAQFWLNKSEGHSVVIIGGPKELRVGQEIAQLIGHHLPEATGRVFDLCGKTSLQEAFAEIEKADTVISNDSGLMHAAAALDVPVIALFGSTDPHHTPPHSVKATVVSLGLSCSPCFQRICPLGTTACLKELRPERVINALGRVQAVQP